MSHRMFVVAVLMLLAPALALAQSAAVSSPTRGVLCDRTSGFCADETGISASWTEKYLGPKAVSEFVKMTEGGDFDGSEFVLSNGVQCKTKINACFVRKGSTEMHEAITQRIWG